MASILVIDDLEEDNPASYISQCRLLLSHHNYFSARSWSNAQKVLNQEKIDVILLDKKLEETPEEELVGIEEVDELSSIFSREEALAKLRENQGIYILKEIKSILPDIPVIMITAFEDEYSAFEAMMEFGAYDYLGELDAEELENKIENALQENLTQEEVDEWKRQGIIFSAESKQMWEVIKTVKQAARTHSTVLILGESGTDKELIAEAIHKRSPRKDKKLMAVNCSALSENLLESELFGHVKGAFTDATSDKKGILEEANGGTIFLDEIGDMSPKLQLA